ncbi:MAG: VWA domain-containing protein [Microbacterium sp.]|uniref:Ca-activated chloride channel family protein n=1 Tax=Microbacterium natoriense TaxID=284570 RepID=A0AAW8EW44_9MICO|nr:MULTISPECIES: VWA domain-containing protein [Microbacterium]MBW8762378.1 VWA domain-containing protein [Microbacterium sp.]MDQ0646426.1 Ca-activated chloride channel family protein [Microbacterium natoriense]
MALANWWIILVAAGVVILAVGIGLFLGLRSRARTAAGERARIARAERLRALPTFRSALRRRVLGLTGILALGAIATLSAGVVAARPMSSQTIQPVNTSRDIMLCLDVSGSMSEVDVEVLSVFEELLEGFKGERIGLTIFNSSPVQVFPLTDDYEFVREHLQSVRESFDYTEDIPEHWVGTLNGDGASLIGDGLAACAMAFDHPDDERSRSVILATDNEVNGASIVTVEEAAAYAKGNGVRVFAINPVQGKDAAVSDELTAAAESTGGQAYGLRDTTTVGDIVTAVQEQDATELRGQAQVVWTDTPNLWIVVLMIASLAFVVVVWRVKL